MQTRLQADQRGGIAQLQDPAAVVDDRATLRNTLITAACLGTVWAGDVAIYVVLPLYAAAFGLDALAVGLLLSVNRVVRILGYGWVAPLALNRKGIMSIENEDPILSGEVGVERAAYVLKNVRAELLAAPV